MKKILYWLKCLAAVIMLSSLGLSATGNTRIDALVCEYHTNPVGIDVQKPRLSWKIVSDQNNVLQTAYEIRVADSPANLNRRNRLIWDSGKVNSSQSVNVEYQGPELESMERVYWQVRVWDNQDKATKWSEPAFWEMGILNPDLWTASWITMENEKEMEGSKPCHYLRKEFSVSKRIKSARVYVSALGLYELYLNGEKVGDELFTPGWTSYKNRIQYQTFDVSDLLKSRNSLGAILGDGWYRGNMGWGGQRNYYGDKLALIAQLHITYSDGTTEIIVTDESWKATTGALIFSDIYNGETYDARLEMPGWATAAFDDSNWETVASLDHPKDILIAPQGAPVKAVEEISPLGIITTPEGDTVLDMGQNMVGWVRLKVNGNRGDTVTLKFAEVLDKEGNFYTDNLRAAKATNVYILKGDGEEIYESRFTFYGFRYVSISDYPQDVTIDILTGVVIHSDLEMTGTFSCNNDLINQLQHNIIWGQKGNFLDVPTDCPQRDERMGWTGDAQVFAPTSCFNMQSAAFWTKWLHDLAADQHENGNVPHVIPDVWGSGGSHGWADAAVIVPWVVYRHYGDIRILEEQYESMKNWVEFVKKEAGEKYIRKPKERQFGDWLAFATTRPDYPGATTDTDFLSTAYFYHSVNLLRQVAEVLGKTEDAAYYGVLQNSVKEAFNREFVTTNGRLSPNTQTAYVVALSFGLLPPELEKAAAARLAEDVNSFGHITTGFLGTADICHILTRYGYLEEAYTLLYRTTYPSWLYPVTQGATTIWERWDGIKPDGTFQNPGMNSFNHYAYGAVGNWLYRVVAGINSDPETPGFKNIIIKPHPGNEMNDVSSTHESMYGTIRSEWQIKNNIFTLRVSIPANTTADVFVPSTGSNLTMNGKSIESKEAPRVDGIKYHFLQTQLGSGDYVFETVFGL